MYSEVTLATNQIRAVFRIKIVGFLAVLVLCWVLQLFVSPYLHPLAMSLAIIAPMIPALAVMQIREPIPTWLVHLALIADAFALTVCIHLGGGVDNVSAPILYTLIIGLAGVLLSPANTAGIALVIISLYDSMTLAEIEGLLTHQVSYSRPLHSQAGTILGLNLYLLLLAWVVSFAVTQVRSTYLRLERQRRDAVHGLAHDLRNPLSVIQGYAYLMHTASEERDRISYSNAIERAATQALDLVSNIVDAAVFQDRPVTPHVAPIQLSALIEEVVSRYQLAGSKADIEIRTSVTPETLVAEIDAQLISRAIANLLANAIKYAGNGSVIRIDARAESERAVIVVSDNGRGIALAEQSDLFEKYSRGSSARGRDGSGLGLFIVRRVAEAHHGSITLVSEPGRGSAFTLTLPLTAEAQSV